MSSISNGVEQETMEMRLVPCDCGSVEHNVIISRFNWSDDPEVPDYEYSFAITLDPSRTFLERIWLGLKYMFGIDSRNYYHDIVLTERQFRNISSIFDEKIRQSTPEVEKPVQK